MLKSCVGVNPILAHQIGVIARTCHTKPSRVATRKERRGVEGSRNPKKNAMPELKTRKKVVLSSLKEVGVANAFLYKLKRIVLWPSSSKAEHTPVKRRVEIS